MIVFEISEVNKMSHTHLLITIFRAYILDENRLFLTHFFNLRQLIKTDSTIMMPECAILWLDTNSSDPNSSFRIKLGDVITFTAVNDCIQYIHEHPNQSVYLIVSGSFAKQVVPEIYESSNLVQIFLFCGSVASYSEWGMDYCDKLMIFDHGDDLLERLWNDLESHLRQQALLYMQYAEKYKQRALEFKQPPCG